MHSISFDTKRRSFLKKMANSTDFASLPQHVREQAVDMCLKKYAESQQSKRVERIFAVCACLSAFVGPIFGFWYWGFWGIFLVTAVLVAVSCVITTIASDYIWRSWVKEFVSSEDLTACAGMPNVNQLKGNQ